MEREPAAGDRGGPRWVRRLLAGVAVASGALLLLRAVAGPYRFVLPVNSPIALECTLAVALLLSLLAARGTGGRDSEFETRRRWRSAAVVVRAVVAAFWPILSMPLVTDDYIHMRQTSAGLAPSPVESLTQASGGPRFFRPAGAALYWMEWRLWGAAAMPRHALDLLLHAASSLLFLVLVRRVGLAFPFDLLAALLYGLNGIRPEVVAWPGARFDALVLLFSLAAALAVLRAYERRSRLAMAGSLLATAMACLSKESAFVLPLLLALLLGRRARTKAGLRLVGGNLAVAAGVFVWRWLVLKGIGGYWGQDDGVPTVLQFRGLTLVKTFLARIWGILWFPVNWSRPVEPWLMVGFLLGIGASLLLLKARPSQGRVALCLLGVVAACLPVHHMLLIDGTLERSRYLAYATPAFILMLAFAYDALPRRTGMAGLALMVLFHAAALEHNLRIWRSVAQARYGLCREVAARRGAARRRSSSAGCHSPWTEFTGATGWRIACWWNSESRSARWK
jgi:hypothetical protein